MKILAFLALFITQSVLAATYTYEVYSENEKQDFIVEVEFSGRFQSTSDLLTLRVWGKQSRGKVLLYNFDYDQVREHFKFKWLTTKALVIASKKPFASVVRQPFESAFSEAPIIQDEEYSLNKVRLNIDGTVGEDLFVIENHHSREVTVKGSLKRKK